MASPMRKKRAWSTLQDDADSQESAAFEASVAAAKDTAAKSVAFLSSAKEDLTDHQRWLRTQSAAVEKDRLRHERWVQRERDQEESALRKERLHRRRQLMRQRAVQAVQQAALDLVLFIRSWIAFVFGKIGGGIKFVALSIASGFAFVGQTIAAGMGWIGAKLGMAAHAVGTGLSAGAAWGGAKVRASATAGNTALAAGSSAVAAEAGKFSQVAGGSIGGGLSTARAKGSSLASAASRASAKGGAVLAAKIFAAGAATKQGLSSVSAWTKFHAAAMPPALYGHMERFGHKVQNFTRARAPISKHQIPAKQQLPVEPQGPALQDTAPTAAASTTAASVHVLQVYGPHRDEIALFGRPANEPWTPEPQAVEPSLAEMAEPAGPSEDSALSSWVQASWVQAARARSAMFGVKASAAAGRAGAWLRRYAGQARSWVGTQPWSNTQGWAKIPAWVNTEALAAAKVRAGTWAGSVRASTETWGLKRGFDLSQMMIVAGAVLLMCGGLLVGGGLLMRAGARTPVMAEVPQETFSGISWMFNESGLPLPDRAVFTLSGTPDAFLINGLSISGLNNSDQALTGLEGVLKPDVKRPDLKLSLKVDLPEITAVDGTAAGQTEGAAAQVLPSGAVPAHTSFRLVFPFPPEAMGGEDGITTDEFFDSYGGLFLTLRYEIDGVQKSVFQYLAPDMLKAQLDEVPAQAGGS